MARRCAKNAQPTWVEEIEREQAHIRSRVFALRLRLRRHPARARGRLRHHELIYRAALTISATVAPAGAVLRLPDRRRRSPASDDATAHALCASATSVRPRRTCGTAALPTRYIRFAFSVRCRWLRTYACLGSNVILALECYFGVARHKATHTATSQREERRVSRRRVANDVVRQNARAAADVRLAIGDLVDAACSPL